MGHIALLSQRICIGGQEDANIPSSKSRNTHVTQQFVNHLVLPVIDRSDIIFIFAKFVYQLNCCREADKLKLTRAIMEQQPPDGGGKIKIRSATLGDLYPDPRIISSLL
jgi:hypothetical protein